MPDFNQSPSRFRDQYLLKEVLRKYPGFDLGIDTEAVAIQGLLDQECRNSETNRRIETLSRGFSPRVWQILEVARCKIEDILGEFDPAVFVEGCRFGPRATSRIRGNTGLSLKLSGKPHVTFSAALAAHRLIGRMPLWAKAIGWKASNPLAALEICDHDVITCVTKNALTGRTVAPQPCMNSYMDLGVGRGMRIKLYAAGVNLQRQSINQNLARRGSIDGTVATVDVANASNSVVRLLVWLLIGDRNRTRDRSWQWYEVMDMLRTEQGLIDGVMHSYELFSSMGNGYTFELETLIFYVLSCSVCASLGLPEDQVSCYGDDIVIPSDAVPLLREVFDSVGFRLNMSKSFWNTSGPLFRESCGKHYLNGVDVTPFYVDGDIDCPSQQILLANNLLRWASLPGFGRDGRVKPVYDWIVSNLPERCRASAIPYGEANDGLIKDFDEAHPVVRYTNGTKNAGPKTVPSVASDSDPYLPFVPKAIRLGNQRVGYVARTAEMSNRPVSPPEDSRYLIWQYQKSFRKFSDVRDPSFTVHSMRFGDIDVTDAPAYHPYKEDGLKSSPKYGYRVVDSWPAIGPWVFEN